MRRLLLQRKHHPFLVSFQEIDCVDLEPISSTPQQQPSSQVPVKSSNNKDSIMGLFAAGPPRNTPSPTPSLPGSYQAAGANPFLSQNSGIFQQPQQQHPLQNPSGFGGSNPFGGSAPTNAPNYQAFDGLQSQPMFAQPSFQPMPLQQQQQQGFAPPPQQPLNPFAVNQFSAQPINVSFFKKEYSSKSPLCRMLLSTTHALVPMHPATRSDLPPALQARC